MHNDDGWEDTPSFPCPECGGGHTQVAGWWDDPPELGGECIGSLRRCTECPWFESY